MPFVVMPLDGWRRGSVYVLFAALSLVAAAVGYWLVEETMDKKLDEEGEAEAMELREVLSDRQRQ